MQPRRGVIFRSGLLVVLLFHFVTRVDQRESDLDDPGPVTSVDGQHVSEESGHSRVRRQNRNGCREVYRDTSGVISSPGYPDDIEDDLFCQWMIITPSEDPLSLVFYFENVTTKGPCPTASEGWVVRDGMDPRGAELMPDCRGTNPHVASISSAITILFNSSSWQSSNAFRIVYSKDPFRNQTLTLPDSNNEVKFKSSTERPTVKPDFFFTELVAVTGTGGIDNTMAVAASSSTNPTPERIMVNENASLSDDALINYTAEPRSTRQLFVTSLSAGTSTTSASTTASTRQPSSLSTSTQSGDTTTAGDAAVNDTSTDRLIYTDKSTSSFLTRLTADASSTLSKYIEGNTTVQPTTSNTIDRTNYSEGNVADTTINPLTEPTMVKISAHFINDTTTIPWTNTAQASVVVPLVRDPSNTTIVSEDTPNTPSTKTQAATNIRAKSTSHTNRTARPVYMKERNSTIYDDDESVTAVIPMAIDTSTENLLLNGSLTNFTTPLPSNVNRNSTQGTPVDYKDGIDGSYHGRMNVPEYEEVTHGSNGDFLQCFFRETGTSGSIFSPEYPDKVEGPNCTWVITAFPSEVIEITFPEIDIDGRTVDGSCDQAFSHLKVTTFDQNFNEQEHIYCQNTENVVHTSSENLWIDFRSHNGLAKFLSEYRSVVDIVPTTDSYEVTEDSAISNQGCRIIIHDSRGVIQTPNFPDFYPKNQECVWTILALPSRSITLRFDEFDIDGPVTASGKCDTNMAHKYSFIKVSYYTNDNALTDETFCGSDMPGIIRSNSNRINVLFQSGNGIGTGFEAHFTSAPRKLNPFGRTFLVDNFDATCTLFINDTAGSIMYNDSMAGPCMWIIQPSTDSSFVLDIEELSFTGLFGQGCEVPPVTIDTIDIDTLQLHEASLCINVTSRIETFTSVSQLNVTLNTSAWIVHSLVANYRLTDELIGIEENSVANQTYESPGTVAPDSQVSVSLSNGTLLHPVMEPTGSMISTDAAFLSNQTQREYPEISTTSDILISTQELSSSASTHAPPRTDASLTICNTTLFAREGRITSPPFQNGSSHFYCSWTLQSSAVMRLQLVFTKVLSVAVTNETCGPISHVSITAINDTSNFSRTDEKMCGPLFPRQINITAREVVVGFLVATKDTFEMSFKWNDNLLQILPPGEQTPPTVSNTPSDSWLVETSDHTDITARSAVPSTEALLTTSAAGTIGESMQLDNVASSSTLPTNKTVNNTITEVFTVPTVSSYETGGTRPCRTNLLNAVGNIFSPNYPNSYPTDLKCIWLLHLENQTTVTVRFREIDLRMNRSHGNACSDQNTYLRITSWTDGQRELETSYICGNITPNDLTVTGHSVVFNFVTGPRQEDAKGFHLSYNTKQTPFRSELDGGVFDLTSSNESSISPAATTEQGDSSSGSGMLTTTTSSAATDVTIPGLDIMASDTRFRLTIFICSGVALVLLCILLVLLILCVRRRNRSSAMTLGPEIVAPGDYWRNYRQWAQSDYPVSVKPEYDPSEPSTSMHPAHQRPVPEQERLV